MLFLRFKYLSWLNKEKVELEQLRSRIGSQILKRKGRSNRVRFRSHPAVQLLAVGNAEAATINDRATAKLQGVTTMQK